MHTARATLTITAPPPDLLPPPGIDMGTGSGGNGDHGGGSGCSVVSGAHGSPAGALSFVVFGFLVTLRLRRRSGIR